MVDITKQIYGEKVQKSPEFAKEIVITFTDDVSVEVMREFNKSEKTWMERMIKEVILEWNLEDEKGNKLPICIASLDIIKSIKLRNWIITTMTEVVVSSLELGKKK